MSSVVEDPPVERKSRSGTSRRHLEAVATARMTSQELERLREVAEENGMSVSEFVRDLVLQAV